MATCHFDLFLMSAISTILADIGNLNIEAVTYQVTGMLVVFCCLGFLSLILSISGRMAVRMEEKRKAAQTAAEHALRTAAVPSTADAPTPAQVAALAAGIYDAAASSITPQLIAVLAAAVRETVGHEARIRSITPVQGNYAQGGRTAVMNSHTPLHS